VQVIAIDVRDNMNSSTNHSIRREMMSECKIGMKKEQDREPKAEHDIGRNNDGMGGARSSGRGNRRLILEII